MDYFEMAGDLPRKNYCTRQVAGEVCMSRTQCVYCELYQAMALSPRYPVPSIHDADTFTQVYAICLIVEFMEAFKHG